MRKRETGTRTSVRVHTLTPCFTPFNPCGHKDINGFSMEASRRPGISWITGTRLPYSRKAFYQCNRPRVAAINSRRPDGNFSPQKRILAFFVPLRTRFDRRTMRSSFTTWSTTLRASLDTASTLRSTFSFSFVRSCSVEYVSSSNNSEFRQKIRLMTSTRNNEENRAQDGRRVNQKNCLILIIELNLASRHS